MPATLSPADDSVYRLNCCKQKRPLQTLCCLFLDVAYGDDSHLLVSITAALRPLAKPKIVRKKTKKFIQQQSDPHIKMKHNRREPRGTDNRAHGRFKRQIPTPSFGYGSNKKTNTCCPVAFGCSWFSVKELEVLLLCDKSYCAKTAHSISSENRKATVERTAWLVVGVTNPSARLRGKENE